MTVASGDIARVLQGARKRQLRVVALASAGFGLAVALVVLLAGAAALGLGARPAVRSAALAGALTALLAAAGLGIRALVRRAWSAEAVARAVSGPLEADQPGLSSDLVSSIQLGREREEIRATGRYSLALVDGHLERTAARARALDLDRAIPDRWARFGGLALLGVVVLHGVALLAAGGTLGRGYERLLEGEPGGTPAAVVDPITGDIELTFAYPAYMKREPRTLSGTGGEVRAPRGTEVSLVTRADRPVAAAELVVQYDQGVAHPSTSPPLRGGSAQGERNGGGSTQGERAGAQGGRNEGGSGQAGREGGGSAQGERKGGESTQGERAGAQGGRRNGGGSTAGEREGAQGERAGAQGERNGGASTLGEREAVQGERAGGGAGQGGRDGRGSAQGELKGARDEREGGKSARDAHTSVRPERSAPEGRAKSKDEPGTPPGPVVKRHALTVTGDRGLSGRFLVAEAGSYRFRFLDRRGKVLAEGPPIPIVLEEDAFPEVRIVRPERELEVDPGARVRVDFAAEDDVGLDEITLVTKPPAGAERRRVLRKPAGVRRDSGGVDLDLGPERLGEGEKLLYWIEASDGDTVSGPKVSASETHTLSVYSEAEHRRQALEKAKQVLEETIGLLADRLETFAAGSVATAERLPLAQALDQRTRQLHERMRDAAREIRRDRAGPKEVAAALANVATAVRLAEARVVNARASVAQAIRVRVKPEGGLLRTMGLFDGQLDAELEKGILYLEQLLDKQRARDLVRLAKDLAERRRELADVMAEYRQAPTDEKKQALLAQVGRMKERVRDLLQRMSELSRGFNDEHMNAEALAEMARSKDLLAGLDDVEQKLAAGDVEGAMKALDGMASQMDRMLAGLQRTAELPDEKQQALMKEMLAFKEAIEDVQAEQQRTAGETEKIRGEYRKQIADKLKKAEDELHRLAELAGEARRDVEAAQPGVGYRAEVEYEQAREALADLERALGMKELGAAAETAQRAAPSVERLAAYLEEDAALAHPDPFAGPRDQRRTREAEQHVRDAVPKAREIRDALAKLFPDPRQVLGQDAQRKLGELSKRQGELERRAGDLQRQLGELMEKAPIFPPQAQGQLGETRGHMGQAAAELGNRNPQRGHGQQELALDALSRFKKGLEEAGKQQGGGAGGMGFPFPFAESGGEEGAEGRDFSREKVAIPGAEAYQVPEEFRKDLLEAMKQGAPERYRGEVQRYYEELVK